MSYTFLWKRQISPAARAFQFNFLNHLRLNPELLVTLLFLSKRSRLQKYKKHNSYLFVIFKGCVICDKKLFFKVFFI